ncbi:uncharacterized protein LOC129752143 [Uranotaenia lowii]|uniref:uncharacterized protein LOC129752143 n=1 Tax=Uranotaenia lowii TaxID=190385 RepID=UPI00247874A3|nr:uncharacterized protein LOC129752143 [Uranotaenia lowii]
MASNREASCLKKGVEAQEKASNRSKGVETRSLLEGRPIKTRRRSSDQEPLKGVGPGANWMVVGSGGLSEVVEPGIIEDRSIVTTNQGIETKRQKYLTIYYQNMNSIRSKKRLETVLLSSLELDYDVFAFCETNLDASISDRMIFPETFSVYRCDRSPTNSDKTSGGGVLIAVNNRFTSTLINESNCNEEVTVKLVIDKIEIFICSIYIPPASGYQRHVSHTANVGSLVKSISPDSKVIIIGDFNLKNTTWYRDKASDLPFLPNNVRLPEESIIIDDMAAFDLRQVCGIANHNNRFLDLIFTNDEESCQVDEILPIIQHEVHHKAMGINVCLNILQYADALSAQESKVTIDMKNFDVDAVSQALLEVEWNTVFLHNEDIPETASSRIRSMLDFLNSLGVFDNIRENDSSIGNALDFNVLSFYTVVYGILLNHCRTIRVKSSRSKYPEWFDSDTIRLLKDKRKKHNKFRRSKSEHDKTAYRTAANLFNSLHRAQRCSYLNELQQNIQSEPKRFWKYVNSKRKSNLIPKNVSYNNNKAESLEDASELFAEYFHSVYRLSNAEIEQERQSPVEILPEFTIAASDIRRKILSLDESKSCGPDGIPNSFLKKCVSGIEEPLQFLFTSSIRAGLFPKFWKISHVIPIHKNGSRLTVENYRGVAILSAIPKLFESIVYDKIHPWIETKTSDVQHGFLKKRSTVTNLTECVSRTSQWMMQGFQVNTIYTDMSKAFDVININALLSVLCKNGITGSCLQWIRSYLIERTQYVKLENVRSSTFSVNSGVPQGSHLGPLLFIAVMNEFPEVLTDVFALVYADDLKMFLPIRHPKDCVTLQNALHRFTECCSRFGLKINSSKCNVITFSRKISNITYEYRLENDFIIARQSSVKDLGVELDAELTFSKHIEKVVAKANSMFGMVSRICHELDNPYTIVSIYTGLVRTVIEYAGIVWRPYYNIHNNRLERVQKKFLKYALRNLGWQAEMPEYRVLCMLVGLETLETRRKSIDALFLKDLICGRYYSPYLLSCISPYEGRSSLRSVRPFQLANRNQNFARNEPMYRMMAFYNTNVDITQLSMSREQIKMNQPSIKSDQLALLNRASFSMNILTDIPQQRQKDWS